MWPFRRAPPARAEGDDASELHGLLASGKAAGAASAPRSGDARAKVCGCVGGGGGFPQVDVWCI